jgi:hypothetical protein
MKNGGAMRLATLFAVMANAADLKMGPMQTKIKPKDGPEFTPEELAHIRSLPRKEKKAAVKALKLKYRGK